MITAKHGATSFICRGPTLQDTDFTLSDNPEETIIVGSSSGQVTIEDSIFDQFTTSTVDTGARIQFSNQVGDFQSPIFTSLDESIATVDQNGVVTRVSDGTVSILVKGQWLARRIDINVFRTESTTSNQLADFVAGSLAKHCSDNLVPKLIDGKDMTLYSTQNHSAATYVRNTNFWGAELDLTSISPWNSNLGNKQAGTLITKKHFICATHYSIFPGSTIRFITQNNTVVERTVLDRTHIGSGGDITISTLDSEVPDDISFAKMLPSNWHDKVGIQYVIIAGNRNVTVNHITTIPGFGTNQNEKAFTMQMNAWVPHQPEKLYPVHGFSFRTNLATVPSSFEPLQDWSGQIIVGDSGNPIFYHNQ